MHVSKIQILNDHQFLSDSTYNEDFDQKADEGVANFFITDIIYVGIGECRYGDGVHAGEQCTG